MGAVRNADGRLEVFGIGSEGSLDHSYQSSSRGPWSHWSGLGGTLKHAIAVARNSDGRLDVFATAGDNELFHISQTAPNNGWSGWANRGGGLLSGPAVYANADGALEIFAVTPDHALWHMKQNAPSGGFGIWQSLGGSVREDGQPWIDAFLTVDGRLELFACFFPDNTLRHIWQTLPGGAWSGWENLGGNIGPPVVGRNADGRRSVCRRCGWRRLAFVATDGRQWTIFIVACARKRGKAFRALPPCYCA